MMVSDVVQELVDELGIRIITFDRAGYGESDPNPQRSVRSEAFNIQELEDLLELGSKFYLVGVSIGSHPTWHSILVFGTMGLKAGWHGSGGSCHELLVAFFSITTSDGYYESCACGLVGEYCRGTL